MPEIWTIAASTGDVIALTPRRAGTQQRGSFNWANVVRHEFVNAVTLGRTHNRLPHCFTEACAVSQETVGRSYDTYQLLAWSLEHDKLFAYEQVNWGFVRPQSPRDRPLAYAQFDWMLEFIAHRFGHYAIIALLDLYAQGYPDARALFEVTGLEPQAFMDLFKSWATGQVAQWGLAHSSGNNRLDALLEGSTQPADAAELAQLLKEYPNHPGLLRLIAEEALNSLDPEAGRAAVLRYALARPVDPWPHRVLAQMALAKGNTRELIAALEHLDRQESNVGAYSYQLANLHRTDGRLEAAGAAAQRALHHEPYNATYRKLAATIAMQCGQLPEALHHLQAMAIIEPDQAVHHLRLAALYQKMNEPDQAQTADLQAQKLNPDAPVDRFIKQAP
jgi:tetratricopeptide (TPR) repeat protein